jgi:iduronate 2-sulfatase
LKLTDNTVIVFLGDHGFHLGEHMHWSKHTNFEVAAQAPLIISVPGIVSQSRTRALVEFVDIYPSLCELCGISMPNTGPAQEGLSFVPLLKNPGLPWKKAVFSVYPHNITGKSEKAGKEVYNGYEKDYAMGTSMRTDQYRFTEWVIPGSSSNELELYDHQTDPEENVNIANLPENFALVGQLKDQLHRGWRAALPDKP